MKLHGLKTKTIKAGNDAKQVIPEIEAGEGDKDEDGN